MEERSELKLFTSATHDPASRDAKDTLRLVEYLEEKNKRLIDMETKQEQITFGARLADRVAAVGGSWGFIVSFLVVLMVWVTLNVTAVIGRWDPYPFILLNLTLSTIAALQAPVILMSQNRQAERDRMRLWIDLERNRLDLEVDTFAAKVTRDAFLKLQEMDGRLKRIEGRLKKRW